MARAPVLDRLTEVVRTLDRLPPVRLPLGGPLPWRYAAPALAALVVFAVVVGRLSPPAEATRAFSPASASGGTHLFASQGGATPTTPSAPPSEAAPLAADLLSLGLKLVFVLALAYGSLVLLRRLGVGGATAATRALPPGDGLRLVSSLVLAPNRVLHVVRAPGGRLLLVGATPTQVNLVADLGERTDLDLAPEPASFLQVLSSKLPSIGS